MITTQQMTKFDSHRCQQTEPERNLRQAALSQYPHLGALAIATTYSLALPLSPSRPPSLSPLSLSLSLPLSLTTLYIVQQCFKAEFS